MLALGWVGCCVGFAAGAVAGFAARAVAGAGLGFGSGGSWARAFHFQRHLPH